MEEVFYGLITLFPYNFVPEGWVICDGSILSINQNQVLFSLIGTQFGGNGINDFALPNLLGTEPAPYIKYYICNNGMYPQRQ